MGNACSAVILKRKIRAEKMRYLGISRYIVTHGWGIAGGILTEEQAEVKSAPRGDSGVDVGVALADYL